jgi:hypothetical protein
MFLRLEASNRRFRRLMGKKIEPKAAFREALRARKIVLRRERSNGLACIGNGLSCAPRSSKTKQMQIMLLLERLVIIEEPKAANKNNYRKKGEALHHVRNCKMFSALEQPQRISIVCCAQNQKHISSSSESGEQ